jgi:uncharacterized protein YuzE
MYEIARRVLSLHSEPPRQVTVTVGLPYEEPGGDWSCPYRIDGLAGWEHERRVSGADSLQALELALGTVRSAIAGSHEARRGALSWDDAPFVGVPQTVYVSWDRVSEVAYIALKREIMPGEVARQEEKGEVVLDVAASGELLGVELLDAHALMPSEMRL